jgi:hypothetical protein
MASQVNGAYYFLQQLETFVGKVSIVKIQRIFEDSKISHDDNWLFGLIKTKIVAEFLMDKTLLTSGGPLTGLICRTISRASEVKPYCNPHSSGYNVQWFAIRLQRDLSRHAEVRDK